MALRHDADTAYQCGYCGRWYVVRCLARDCETRHEQGDDMRNDNGYTLVETVILVALILLAFFGVLYLIANH